MNQNIKLYVLCRHKLGLTVDEIYCELKILLKSKPNKNLLQKWTKLYDSEKNSRKKETMIKYCKNNQIESNALFKFPMSKQGSHRILKMKFYALCRYQLKAKLKPIMKELNFLFLEDNLNVINSWIQESKNGLTEALESEKNYFNTDKIKELEDKIAILINDNLKNKTNEQLQQVDSQNISLQNRIVELENLNRKLSSELEEVRCKYTKLKIMYKSETNKNEKLESDVTNITKQLNEVKKFPQEKYDLLKTEYLNLSSKYSNIKCELINSSNESLKLKTKEFQKRLYQYKKYRGKTNQLISYHRIKQRELFYIKFKYQTNRHRFHLKRLIHEVKEKFLKHISSLKRQIKSSDALKEPKIKVEKFEYYG